MISNDRSTLIGLLYGCLTVVLHLYGRYKDWWWYDNLAHLSGGVALGGLVSTPDSTLRSDALLIGVLTLSWELFEYVTNTYPWDGTLPKRAAAEETILDSILVGFGAWLVASDSED